MARTNGTDSETSGITLPEGDAVSIMRRALDNQNSPTFCALIRYLGISDGLSSSWHEAQEALRMLADMVERDYVQRMDYEDAVELCGKYADSIHELCSERDHYIELFHEQERRANDLQDKARRVDESDSRWEAAIRDLECMTAERDEWKRKAESCNPCGWWNGNLQYCERDDGVKRSMTNLEWLWENDREAVIDNISCDKSCGDCTFYRYRVSERHPSYKCMDIREWLMAEHEPCTFQAEKVQGCTEGDGETPDGDSGQIADMSEKNASCVRSEPGMSAMDAQRDTNGTCPDGNGTASDDRPNLGSDLGTSEPETSTVAEVDSREKLEADVHQYANPSGGTNNIGACWEKKMVGFLDRQAAITRSECFSECDKCAEDTRHRVTELQAKVDELTANRPISQSDAPKSEETAETDAAKCEIRDLDDTREKLDGEDSQEKLERDMFYEVIDLWNEAYRCGREGKVGGYGKDRVFMELLDRQAAITELECRKPNWYYCDTCEELSRMKKVIKKQADSFAKLERKLAEKEGGR